MSMAADIAEIKTNVKWIKERALEDRAAQEGLEARVDELEKSRIRTSAWAAGFGAAAAFLFSLLKDKLLALLGVGTVLLATGCAASPIGFAKWPVYAKPVQVLVAPNTPADCADTILTQVKFWRNQGADYLLDPRTAPIPEYPGADWATIAVEYVGDAIVELHPGAAAVAMPQTEPKLRGDSIKQLFATHIALGSCAPSTVAHELGHALGLEDNYEDKLNVMYFSTAGASFGVDDEQRAWVK